MKSIEITVYETNLFVEHLVSLETVTDLTLGLRYIMEPEMKDHPNKRPPVFQGHCFHISMQMKPLTKDHSSFKTKFADFSVALKEGFKWSVKRASTVFCHTWQMQPNSR